MSYLYHEASNAQRTELANHLRQCPACAALVDDWKATAGELAVFSIPRTTRPVAKRAIIGVPLPILRWAAAAMLLAVIGFGAGRLNSVMTDGEKLRAEIEPRIRQQLQQEFEAKRLEDNRAMLAELAKLDSRRLADYLSLKSELDTVAVLTDAGLRSTEQQLAQLADGTQSADSKTR